MSGTVFIDGGAPSGLPAAPSLSLADGIIVAQGGIPGIAGSATVREATLSQLIATIQAAQPMNPNLHASIAAETARQFKVGSTDLFSVRATGLSDFAWLLVFDAAAIPPDGAVTPVAAIQATSLVQVSLDFGGAAATLNNGLAVALSSTGPFVKTTAPTGFFSVLYR